MAPSSGGCACGAVRFGLHGRPLLRLFCHCTICQSFNQAPFADVTVLRARDVTLAQPEGVAFRTFRPPPAVRRGTCRVCDKPAIEYLWLPPVPRLAIIPSANLDGGAGALPAPALHVFYDRRVADIDDALPRYDGYLRSQLAISRRLVSALLHRG